MLHEQPTAAYDARYQTADPWGYEGRAAEVMKYDYLVELLAPLATGPAVDVGCAQGLLTARLVELGVPTAAVDLSPLALQRVTLRAERAAASADRLPLGDASVQLYVLSDGLVSWGIGPVQQREVVREARRVLRPGGRAVFMDYLNPRRHHELLGSVGSHLTIERIEYLNDRLWYVTESAFRALEGTGLYRAVAGSAAWARGLKGLSRLLGRRGSKHLCVVARP